MKEKKTLPIIALTLLLLTSTTLGASTIDIGGEDPLAGFYYYVDAPGMLTGYFIQIGGVGSETEVIEHKVVNEAGVEVVMKVPGRLKWHNLTLTRGITSNMEAWNWRRMVENGNVAGARSDLSVTMLDQAGTAVAVWNCLNAWPVKVSASKDAEGNTTEELVLVYEYCERVE